MLARLRACRRGVSALEFALVAPVLALMALGGFDLGNAVLQNLRLEAAARAGAQYAFTRPTDGAGITAAIRANLPGWADITVPDPVVACRCEDGSTVSCTGGSCGTAAPAMYVSIEVNRPFIASTPLTAAVFPSTVLHGHAELRLR
ncbi:pilus assembly protein [Roseomonas sp. E05]|uniref:TadE/TadG family type IV pilus assembly protein n=1 Tax=Roseomonas sp. E05 TaxID=3046310 RepID=UPI0024B8E654|nr:TadE/TadG family type IV pilus assembly protein [Roseomonas sp. E05]MDJ0391285.1 pilus assembly protein [Roseomonas sp. E05]